MVGRTPWSAAGPPAGFFGPFSRPCTLVLYDRLSCLSSGKPTPCMTLDQSYAHCRTVARHRAKNFYYSFLLLPRDQRNAMCAVYTFMRYSDDLSDEPGASREPLERWRIALDHALAGQYDGHPARERTTRSRSRCSTWYTREADRHCGR